MSFVTGTVAETLYASTASGATLATFTTEALLNTVATMGVQPHLPPDFWLPNQNQIGRGIKISAKGVLSTTSSGPNYTFAIRGGAAANASAAPILAATAATTMAANLSNVLWELEVDLFLSVMGGAGTNSTLRGMGHLIVGGATPLVAPVWGGGSSPGTIATVDTSIAQYINVTATSSASNASNAITLHQLNVFGLN